MDQPYRYLRHSYLCKQAHTCASDLRLDRMTIAPLRRQEIGQALRLGLRSGDRRQCDLALAILLDELHPLSRWRDNLDARLERPLGFDQLLPKHLAFRRQAGHFDLNKRQLLACHVAFPSRYVVGMIA